jgi:uncharacterized repeat protein (TIGR03803 family)
MPGRTACTIFLLWAISSIASAQTLTTIYSFGSVDGLYPRVGLVQGTDGNFYGATAGGGANSHGTVFRVTPSGVLTTLYDFCAQADCADGANPNGLIQGLDGYFYGTTNGVGTSSSGTVFKITPAGVLTTLYSFCAKTDCGDGQYPQAALVQGTDGNFYGVTSNGGANSLGTVFVVTSNGQLRTLYSFCSQAGCTDGQSPYTGLVQSTDGNFYGTTVAGGTNCATGICGTAFRMTPGGRLTTLYNFCSVAGCTDGAVPYSSLLQAADGNFYGATFAGGIPNCPNGCGTIFKLTRNGQQTTLYSFCSQSACPDGYYPYAGLKQGTDGRFYGTTANGGQFTLGTVFKITAQAHLTTLYSFCSDFPFCSDGASPYGDLLQGTDGKFYGTTTLGGGSSENAGTIFRLTTGLGPFVETRPTSGKVGAKVIILGNKLTGSSSVTFNGVSASFTVVSATEITTKVPNGATTGTVSVITPHGTLSSNVVFRVNP